MKLRGVYFILLVYLNCQEALSLTLKNENLNLILDFSADDGIKFSLTLDDDEKLSGSIGEGALQKVTESEACEGQSSCILEGDDVSLKIVGVSGSFSIYWETSNLDSEFQDCLNLDRSASAWYGGPEKWQEDWPVENIQFNKRAYTTIKSDNGAVSERYWLNSRGSYIFVGDRVPLFVDQNNIREDTICFITSTADPYVQRTKNHLEYYLGANVDAKQAHLDAVNNFLGKPQGHPDERIIRNPIWTTWAKYKKGINDDTVVEFAQDISDHGFTGQLEIDDYWETCYGSLIFNDDQFSQINSTVQTLKDLGFTVTLWTHPFVNDDCQEAAAYGQEHDLFVKSVDGSDVTSWWDGNPAHYIDFTNEEARNWFTDRLKLLQTTHGIDSFKFDAGESDYPPLNSVGAAADPEEAPNVLTSSYINTCATFGGLIEVRSAWRTQNLPIFLRMLDKDSGWGLGNGLHSLITTLLQFNINGYTMVLPDMIGGNGYGDLPTAELLARWTQANTFMPTMQFSYLPWEITSDEFDGLEIIKTFVALHEQYSDEIIKAMNGSIESGTPVNPPVWWADPTNTDLWRVNDEFLLGETILVAPIIEQGATSRNVILPSGSWQDGNTGEVYEGPQVIADYPAPIDVLPYFIKQ